MKNNFSSRRLAGFTLIEFLLGISIFSILALSLYMTFANGLKVSRRAQASLDLYREIRWSLEAISLDLENMIAFSYLGEGTKPQLAFQGDAQSLSLVLATEDELRVVRYYQQHPQESHVHQVLIGSHASKNVPVIAKYEQTGDRIHFLIREEQPMTTLFKSRGKEENAAATEVLSQNTQAGSLKFSYAYAQDKEAKTITWQDEWHEPSLPAGVKIALTFIDPESQATIPFEKSVLIPTGTWGKSGG